MSREPGRSGPDRTGADPVAVLDVLGVGFGPSNLALALAVQEHNERAPASARVDAAFVEQQAAFGWHRGMLLEGATMQVSFLKDLVTMRDPTSPRSFLNYLYGQGRLADFINTKTMFPSRIEFHDYLEWCAADVRHLVSYGTRAIAVHPVPRPDGTVDALDVVLRDAQGDASSTRVVRTRNLVLATGLVPWLPPGVQRGHRIWHNSELLPRLADLTLVAPRSRRYVVIGAGQSAAEATAYLHDREDAAEVHSVFSRYGYSPADDTSFANRIFDPEAVDHFYAAPGEVKQMLMDYHANTNYSVVDPELIGDLYQRAYQEKVHGPQRLHVHGACRVAGVRSPAPDVDGDGPGDAAQRSSTVEPGDAAQRSSTVEPGDAAQRSSTHGPGDAAQRSSTRKERGPDIEIDVEFLPTGHTRTLRADVVVYATGYRPIDPSGLLGDVGAWCRRAEDGELLVERDYRLHTVHPLEAGVYLQGPTEHTHGISSTLLSTTAVRAAEILDSVLGHRRPVPDVSVAHDEAGEPATLGSGWGDPGVITP